MTRTEAQEIINDAGFTGIVVVDVDNENKVLSLRTEEPQAINPVMELFPDWNSSLEVTEI